MKDHAEMPGETMTPTNDLPEPTGDRPNKETGFDLHRAYRAMIREIMRRQLLHRTASAAAKEEPHA